MPKKIAPRAVSLEVARLLQSERIKQGISLRGLAAMSGLSQSMVGYVEQGARNPTLDTLLRLANALDVDLARLIKEATH